MTDEPSRQTPESPKFEPEILPPERMESAFRSDRAFAGVRIVRIGPLRLAFWIVGFLALLALLLFVFASALLVLAPFVAAIIVGSVAWAWLRRFFKSGR
jgi:hypothetical protein